ncbi:MAG: shikimate kinase [Deltaproteobacteria bacterium]|nr:shikimate kinase [Deltaproteobacteria bacterium]
MNIVLIGYRGAGKSSIGKLLATRTGRRFVDTDELIEKRLGSSIREIVEKWGWSHFRNGEKKIIEEISGGNNLVIAPGGGAVLEPQNIKFLKQNGLFIWLKADKEILYKRMMAEQETLANRPTLTGKGTLEELEEVMMSREPVYEGVADIQIDTSHLNKEAVADKILVILPEKMEA